MSSTSNQAVDIKIEESDLPVLSAVATRAMKMINSGQSTAASLQKLIELDQALTSRLLRIANSPAYGGKVKINSIQQAVVRLGLAQLRDTILLAAIGDVFDLNDSHASAMWEHSMAVALGSHWLARELASGNADEAFLAGMLHDIGKVMIYRQAPEIYGELIDQAMTSSTRFFEREKIKINFCTHESIGAVVGRKWSLDAEIVEVIRFHHDIEENADVVVENKPLVAIVSLANLMANLCGFGCENPETINVLETKAAELMGLKAETVDQFLSALPQIVEEETGQLK